MADEAPNYARLRMFAGAMLVASALILLGALVLLVLGQSEWWLMLVVAVLDIVCATLLLVGVHEAERHGRGAVRQAAVVRRRRRSRAR